MTSEQLRAKAELDKMRSKLSEWLVLQSKIDDVLAGRIKGAYSPAVAASIDAAYRDKRVEGKLAELLRSFLIEVYGSSEALVAADARTLAQMVVTGNVPTKTPTGIAPLILLIVVGGVAWVIMHSIDTVADAANANAERRLCQQGISEYCPFQWGKWILVLAGAYFLAPIALDAWKGKRGRR